MTEVLYNNFVAVEKERLKAVSQQQEDFNLAGGASGANLDASQRVAEAEPLFSVTDTSQFGRAVAGSPVANVYEWGKRQLIAADPKFNIETRINEITESVPGEYWGRFLGVQSDAELDELKQQIHEELEDKQMLAQSGIKGLTATLLAEVVNPVNYIPLAASVAGPRAAHLAGKAGMGARGQSTVYGAVAGIETGALSAAATELTSETGDLAAIPAAAMAGFVLGGGVGFTGVFEDMVNKSTAKFSETYQPRTPGPIITNHRPITFGDSSVGASSLTQDASDLVNEKNLGLIKEAQQYLTDTQTPIDTDIGLGATMYRAVQKIPFFQTSSDKLTNSDSAVFEMLAHKLYESPSGKYRNNRSASMMGDGYVGNIAAPVVPMQKKLYKQWLQETQQTDSQVAFKNFLRESATDMQSWYHEGVRSYSTKAVQQFNDLRNEGAKRARRAMKGEDGETPVRGSEDLPEEDGWSPVRWKQAGFDEAIDTYFVNKKDGLAAIEAGLTNGYQKIYPRMARKDLAIWAKAVMRRTQALSHGIDTSLVRMLDEEGVEYGVKMLMDSGVSEETAQRLIKELRGLKAEETQIKILKSRNEIDLREPIPGTNLQLMDLTELDHAKTWSQYSRVAGMNSGLARAGIPDRETLSDLIDAGQAELEAKGMPRIAEDEIEILKTAFTGRSLSKGINPWIRRATSSTNLALLNGQGITQLAESGMMLGYFGMDTFLNLGGKELQDIVKGRSIPAMKEMSYWGTHIDGEENILAPELDLDDWRNQADNWKNMEGFIDNALIKGRRIQSKITGFEAVKNAQQRLVTRMIMQKIANVAKGTEVMSDARLFDMGVSTKTDQEVFSRVLKNMQKAEYNADGELVSLKLENWDYTDFRDFGSFVRRTVNQQVQKLNRGESSAYISSDAGHVLTNLKTFTLLAINKQTVRSMRMLDSETAASWMYGFLAAGMVYAAKEVVSGREDMKLGPMELAKGAFALGNMTGSVAMVADPLGALLGIDSMKFNNYARPGVAGGTVLPTPPVITTGEKMVHIPESLFSVMMGNYDKQDVTSLQTLPLIGNFPGMGYMWNSLKREAEERKRAEKKEEKKAKKAAEAEKPPEVNPDVTVMDFVK